MSMPTTTDHLRRAPLFAGMTDRAIESIAALAMELDFADGEALVTEGQPGDAFLVIVGGRARVNQGGVTLAELGPGDFLGEISLVDGQPRTASVTAVGPVSTLIVRREGFQRLMDEHPAVRYGILSALTQRIRRTAASLGD
jgi:CRP-like cAMP-binding protein